MSLLELRDVSKFHQRGSRRLEILRDVSLELEPGELVAVWGMRRSGRSTLLALAAGVDVPDAGQVLFGGKDLSARGASGLGNGIGYCHQAGHPSGRKVIDNVKAGLLGRSVAVPAAYSLAHEALERVGARDCVDLALGDLDAAEAVRVAIACALVLRPQLLVIDEPTKGVDLLERDALVLLLRSLAKEDITVLVSDGEGSGLCDADRTLTLGSGSLRGQITPQARGTLVRLSPRSTAA